jgi:hypothetical protein
MRSSLNPARCRDGELGVKITRAQRIWLKKYLVYQDAARFNELFTVTCIHRGSGGATIIIEVIVKHLLPGGFQRGISLPLFSVFIDFIVRHGTRNFLSAFFMLHYAQCALCCFSSLAQFSRNHK